jgi:hypothetical protein
MINPINNDGLSPNKHDFTSAAKSPRPTRKQHRGQTTFPPAANFFAWATRRTSNKLAQKRQKQRHPGAAPMKSVASQVVSGLTPELLRIPEKKPPALQRAAFFQAAHRSARREAN